MPLTVHLDCVTPLSLTHSLTPRVVPVVLLNTAATLLQHHASTTAAETAAAGVAVTTANGTSTTTSTRTTTSSSTKTSLPTGEVLGVVHAACTAAACVSRCWPVLQKVAVQQEELCDALAECHPPAGVFAGLTTVCWQQYTLPAEVRLPVLPLLQLVVKLIWQLQPPWQQRPAALSQQDGGVGGSTTLGVCPATAASAASGASTLEPAADSSSSTSKQILSPEAGECIDCLLEVLTAASKLPWETQHTHTARHRQTKQQGTTSSSVNTAAHRTLHLNAAGGGENNDDDDGSSSSSSVESVGEVDAQLVAEAWQQECQPVAAAVEACLRTAGQVAAAADGTLDWKPGGLVVAPQQQQQQTAAAAAPQRKAQRHPSAVALGSCLASLCAPFGRPGPLVAAAAAAPPGGQEQQQMFSLLVSKLKVLLYNPASKKASLIAMHPIEQVRPLGWRLLSAESGTDKDTTGVVAVHTLI